MSRTKFFAWLRRFLKRAFLNAWGGISACSTLATFIFPGLGAYRISVFLGCLFIGVCIASYRLTAELDGVIADRDELIVRLDEEIKQLSASTAKLTIHQTSKTSCWYGHRTAQITHADFGGMYLDFNLVIENSGTKNSIVQTFSVEIPVLGLEYKNLRPQEGITQIQTRHCVMAFNPTHELSRSGMIQIVAGTATKPGPLMFKIPDGNIQLFVDHGFTMHGEEKRLGAFRCKLTVADNNNATTSAEFDMQEG